jgi:hypothetical protein
MLLLFSRRLQFVSLDRLDVLKLFPSLTGFRSVRPQAERSGRFRGIRAVAQHFPPQSACLRQDSVYETPTSFSCHGSTILVSTDTFGLTFSSTRAVAFRLYDLRGTGYIEKEEVLYILYFFFCNEPLVSTPLSTLHY